MLTPYKFQTDAADAVLRAYAEGRKLAVVSPTGSGKSVIQALVANTQRDRGVRHVQSVPSLEIGLGVVRKMFALRGTTMPAWNSEEHLRAICEQNDVWTVKTLYNRLMTGAIELPASVMFDEGHHTTDNTHVVVRELCGCPAAMMTATYYRGTPDETAKLRETWGEPYTAITLKDAVAQGFVARPTFSCWPLVNDETIEVVNGEFQVKAVEGKTRKVLPDLLDRLAAYYGAEEGAWLRPLTVVCPSVALAEEVAKAMNDAGLPAVAVTGETTNRQGVFTRVTNREVALVQVRVVGEGVDLPLRVMVDLSPTLSPVLWMQRVGRITRPSEEPPEYVACNHNLTRHAYLWAGLIPASAVRNAQTVWGPDFKPSRRSLARAVGLEGFGKFKISTVPLVDGSLVSLYTLQTKDGCHQYAVMMHPCKADPWFFERSNETTGEKGVFTRGDVTIEYSKKLYGKWHRVPSVPNLEGYTTPKPGPMTDKQLAWWKRSAAGRGFDPNHEPDGREFQVLPIMLDAGLKFKLEA